MGKNGYLQKQAEMKQALVQATCDIYSQYMQDIAVIALAEEFGFGEKRIARFIATLHENAEAFHDALGVRNRAEEMEGNQEYLQEKLDERLKACMGANYQLGFNERYPMVRSVRYK